MTFEEWWDKEYKGRMNGSKYLARKAWNAAKKEEAREIYEMLDDEHDSQDDAIVKLCLRLMDELESRHPELLPSGSDSDRKDGETDEN